MPEHNVTCGCPKCRPRHGSPLFPGLHNPTCGCASCQEIKRAHAVPDPHGLGFTPAGIVVGEVARGSDAARAGLQPLDVIVAVNGAPVRLFGQLAQLFGRRPRELSFRLTVLRGGESREIDMSEFTPGGGGR